MKRLAWVGVSLLGCGRSELPVEDPRPSHIACAAGFADCDGDGYCETEVASDDISCGQCGNACEDGLVCGGGRCVPSSAVVDVDAGYDFACALRADRRVFCWGYNRYGQVSVAVPNERVSQPVEVDLGGELVLGLSSQHDRSCVRLQSGGLCWGYGKGWKGRPVEPAPSLPELAYLAADQCALTRDGEIWCWGDNSRGGLGDGTDTDSFEVPVRTLIDDAIGYADRCALLATGEVRCWGAYFSSNVPVLIDDFPLLTSIKGGPDWCGVTAVDHLAYMSNMVASRPPTHHAAQVDCGGRIKCLRTTEGTVECGLSYLEYEPVAGLIGVTDVAVGQNFACAVRDRGDVLCWGDNEEGQLGDGTLDPHDDPRPVIGLDVP